MHEKARKKILKYLRYVLDIPYSPTNPLIMKSVMMNFLSPHVRENVLEQEFAKLCDEGVLEVMSSTGRPDQLYYIQREHSIWKV